MIKTRTTDRTPADELWAILKRIPPLDLGNLTSADIICEGREERTDQILEAVTRSTGHTARIDYIE